VSKIQKYFGSLVATFALLITLVLGFANPASAAPYCERSGPGSIPSCSSSVCFTNPDPGETLEIGETFWVTGFVTPSECPADYPTPNYVELCLPFGGSSNCDDDLKSVDGNGNWSSLQVLNQRGDREIVGTGFHGSNQVTRQTRLPISVE